MAVDNTNAAKRVKVGSCRVEFDGIDLGLTKGGVEIAVATETYVVEVDQFGSSPINEYVTGRTVKVRVPMAETDLDKLALITPGAVLVPNNSNSKKRLVVNTATGESLLKTSGMLICRPVNSDDTSDIFVVPIANAKGEYTFAYKLNEERIYTVEFTGYTNVETGQLFYFGYDGEDNSGGGTAPPTDEGVTPSGRWSDDAQWNDTSNWKDS